MLIWYGIAKKVVIHKNNNRVFLHIGAADYLTTVLVNGKSAGRQKYSGQPVFVSEYGGIKWETDASVKSWGYGKDVKTPEEFVQRYCGLTDALIQNEKMFDFCYTQLYDIEQEQNGLYTYDRQKKFEDEIYLQIKETNSQKAAIE